MNKSNLNILYTFLLCILFSVIGRSQVSTYSFAQAAGSPTLLTAAYTQHTSGTTDYGVYQNVALGFTFTYNCVNYTAISISNDGWIEMGATLANNTYTPIDGTDNNIIAVLAEDLQGLSTGSLRSKMTGTAPNRQFTVEWQHYELWGGAEDYTFQVVLTETSNTIQFYYSNSTTTAGNGLQVGLRGASAADFNNRTKANATNWTASAAGTVNSDVMSTGGSAARSPNGIFTFTPTAPTCSGTPTGGTAAASPTSTSCAAPNTSLSLTGSSTGCGLTYQWQSAPAAAGPWTNVAGATASTYTASPVGNTYYRCVITCTASGLSANSASVLVNSTTTPPANDDCLNAVTLISGITCTVTAGTIGCATASAQASGGCFGTSDDDVWYQFVATATSHTISLTNIAGSTTDLYHNVYSGSCAAPGTALSCSDPNTSTVTGLTIGNTYYIRVYSWTSTAGQTSTFDICVTGCTGTPVNDNCTGAIALTMNPYGSCATTSAGNVSCASASGTAVGSCFGNPDDDIWYSFVATGSAHQVTLTTSSGFDAYMQLYSGTCGALSSIQCSDPNTFNATGLTIGNTYYIRVYSYSAGTPNNGSITLCVSAPPSCPANLGAGNVNIASLPYNGTGQTTCGAGNDVTAANAVTCGSTTYLADADKVYIFTPSSSGNITVTLNSTQSWTAATLYEGCPFTGNCVAYVQTSGSGSKNFCTNVISGTTYYLVIDGWGTAGSCITTFSLNITAPSAGASNELACGATALTFGAAVTGNNTCTGSTGEPAIPSCWTSGSANTVWYSFVAPASGIAYIQTTAATITSTQIALYSGACGSLTLVSCNQYPPAGCSGTTSTGSLINASGLTGGATYYVRVDGRNDNMGTFSIVVDNGTSGTSSPVPGQDCQIPLVVCNSTMIIGNPGYANTGNICDFDGSDNCTSGELNSVWYQISIAATGNFNFNLMPNDGTNNSCGTETDYDYLLWRVSGTGATTNCAGITSAASTALLACNFDGYGVTGIAPGGNAPAPYNSCFNFAFEPTVPVTAGDVLYLCVQNFSGSTQGFTLDMSSSGAGVVNYTAPSTVYWTGGASTVWSNPTNWGSCGTFPICGVNAVITAASATQPIITGTEYVKDLTINPGATLTLNAGAVLHICGNFTNNGTFTASPTSTVIFDNAAVAQSIAGSFTAANKFGHLTVTKTGGSVTVNNDIDVAGNFTTTNATSVFNSNNFYIKVAGNFANAAGNTSYTNTGTIGVLEFNGTGTQTYNQGSSVLDLNGVVMNNSSTGTGLTLQTNMNIKSSTGTLTLTAGKITTTAGFMVIVNNSTPASVSTGNSTSYVNGFLRRYINNSTGSFDFPVGISTSYQRANINFTLAPTITYLTADFQTYATVPAALGSSECGTTYDASALDNGFWNIEANTANNNTGRYNMTLYNTTYTNAASGWTVMARHNGSATWALVNGDGSMGNCVASPVTAVVRNDMVGFSRFGTAQATLPLPIELLSFSGENEGAKNKLEWSTLSEKNNDYFTLERSENGIIFESFGTKDGAGNSNQLIDYTYYDNAPYNGLTYYRLKQTDYDGKYTYSSIISIKNELNKIAVSNVHPNPTTSDLNFDFFSPVSGRISIQVLDMTGRMLINNTMSLEQGASTITTEMEALSKGIYSLRISFEHGSFISNTKIIKH